MARKAADAEAKLKKEEAAAAAEMAEAAKTKFTKSKRKSTTPRRSFAEASTVAGRRGFSSGVPRGDFAPLFLFLLSFCSWWELCRSLVRF